MIFTYRIPMLIVLVYRLVPSGIRGRYPYFGRRPSTSHLAVRWMHEGMNGWIAIGRALADNGGYHPDR